MRKILKPIMMALMLLTTAISFSQAQDASANAEILTKAKEWVSALNLTDVAKKNSRRECYCRSFNGRERLA